MRKIKKTPKFIQQYKECESKYGKDIVALDKVVLILEHGHKLNPKYKDHALYGE
jgi:mRNA-degrading endonuclease YafQ of YafQ-DinJ toxin-antitoxin module